MCVKYAGGQDCNITERLKIGKEAEREKEAGKYRERKEKVLFLLLLVVGWLVGGACLFVFCLFVFIIQ